MKLQPGDRILVSGLEHNAVMRPLCQMEKRGVIYDVIPTNQEGVINSSDVEALIRKETKAVIVLHALNVCGTVVPIEEIGEI